MPCQPVARQICFADQHVRVRHTADGERVDGRDAIAEADQLHRITLGLVVGGIGPDGSIVGEAAGLVDDLEKRRRWRERNAGAQIDRAIELNRFAKACGIRHPCPALVEHRLGIVWIIEEGLDLVQIDGVRMKLLQAWADPLDDLPVNRALGDPGREGGHLRRLGNAAPLAVEPGDAVGPIGLHADVPADTGTVTGIDGPLRNADDLAQGVAFLVFDAIVQLDVHTPSYPERVVSD